MAAPSLKVPLLTVKQVARRVGVSVRTVWRMLARGWLPKPYYPSPHSPRWELDKLEAALGLTRRE